MITVYYFDASVLAKLYIDEDGSTEARELFHNASVRKTTSLCFAETLAVLKSKLFNKNRVDEYLNATLDFIVTVKDTWISIEEQSVFNREMLDKAHSMVKECKVKRCKIDLADIFQILSIENSIYNDNGIKCVLVTADKNLANVAKSRGITTRLI